VQATLGHSSVATTSRYLHARPGDSSARFLSLERFSPKTGRIALPSFRAGVMNVVIAAAAAKGERQKMSTNNAETKDAVPVSGESPRKANIRAQKPRVAPAKGKAGKKGHLHQEVPQSAQSR
jgi:hypothetical protein